MVKHACSLIAKLKEDQAEEESAHNVMHKLNDQGKAGTHCAQQHDSQKHQELLEARDISMIPTQTLPYYNFHLLQQCTRCSHQRAVCRGSTASEEWYESTLGLFHKQCRYSLVWLQLCHAVRGVRLLGAIGQLAVVCHLTEERHQLTLLRINELNNCKVEERNLN